ncbi:OmpA family protein [Tenacibaculum sp. AHE15PA]|uniref:OmpA family protein n=1 Tax=unclassified Tenacibaculum TaxID=2635139 RepID=UPI001C4FD72C|nr:OmpA family protein [Tenacibaculum sp. AHE14PA]QXP75931.1 OmpA family protein [Tenacibaculum sp. AHE15PA]
MYKIQILQSLRLKIVKLNLKLKKIEAHTDSRGSDRYNEVLSDKRAKAARDHIISCAITSNRIQSAIGYGEKNIVNKCKNDITCTEEEHQKIMRSKFIILNNFK